MRTHINTPLKAFSPTELRQSAAQEEVSRPGWWTEETVCCRVRRTSGGQHQGRPPFL